MSPAASELPALKCPHPINPPMYGNGQKALGVKLEDTRFTHDEKERILI